MHPGFLRGSGCISQRVLRLGIVGYLPAVPGFFMVPSDRRHQEYLSFYDAEALLPAQRFLYYLRGM